MIIKADARRAGKTTEAIKFASSTGSILLVKDANRARFAEQISRDIGYPVQIATVADYFRYPGRISSRERVFDRRIVIDDLETVLRDIFNASVIMSTVHGYIEGTEEQTTMDTDYIPFVHLKEGEVDE